MTESAISKLVNVIAQVAVSLAAVSTVTVDV